MKAAFASIAPARPVDAAMLAIVHAFAFGEREAWGPDAMALTLTLPGAFGFLRPGAGLVLARAVSDEAEVLTLGVVPAARREGLGSALLQFAKAEAAGRGATAMFLEVSALNHAARRLYESAGFLEVGRRANYYSDGSDALLLRAGLSPAATGAG